MILNQSNSHDIEKYYRGSYVKLPGYGDKLFFIDNVDSTGVYFVDDTQKKGVIYLDDDHPYELDFVLPHKALFQVGKYAHLMSRIPARQYHRGITCENCSIFRLGDIWRAQELTWSLLNYYVSKTPYVTLSVAMKNNFVSAALSQRISWSATTGKLYCDRVSIGEVKKGTNSILIHPLFESEVRQLLVDMKDNTDYKLFFMSLEE